jgi:hypothetical protein
MAWPSPINDFEFDDHRTTGLERATTGYDKFKPWKLKLYSDEDIAALEAELAAAGFGPQNGITVGQTWPRERRIVT